MKTIWLVEKISVLRGLRGNVNRWEGTFRPNMEAGGKGRECGGVYQEHLHCVLSSIALTLG